MKSIISLIFGVALLSFVLADDRSDLRSRSRGSDERYDTDDDRNVLKLIEELARCPRCYRGDARYLRGDRDDSRENLRMEPASAESGKSRPSNPNSQMLQLISRLARCPECWLGIGLG